MDDIVKASLAKWPNVPHCYGWLALDARGHWRMRDEQAQAQNLPGNIIRHEALIAFINRNYDHDERGCWYFQNGPQRVYVNLEATPFIAQAASNDELRLHTGIAFDNIERAYMTGEGELILQSGKALAKVDDRDLATLVSYFSFREADAELIAPNLDDDTLYQWLIDADEMSCNLRLYLALPNATPLTVKHAQLEDLMTEMAYIKHPQSA